MKNRNLTDEIKVDEIGGHKQSKITSNSVIKYNEPKALQGLDLVYWDYIRGLIPNDAMEFIGEVQTLPSVEPSDDGTVAIYDDEFWIVEDGQWIKFGSSKVFTSNSPTITLTGLGTEASPLKGEVKDSPKLGGKAASEYAKDSAVVHTSEKGQAGGVATLNSSGKVPSAQLPEMPNAVVTEPSMNDFPAVGEENTLYVATDTGLQYVWDGTGYTQTSSNLSLGETSSTAYRGDRGKAAYDHSRLTSGNPHDVTKAEVGLGNVTNDAQLAISKNLSDLDDKEIARDNLGIGKGKTTFVGQSGIEVSGDTESNANQSDNRETNIGLTQGTLDDISKGVDAKDKIDDLKVGGRNLSKRTSSEWKTRTFSGWDFRVSSEKIPAKGGTILTAAIELRNVENGDVSLRFREYDDEDNMTQGGNANYVDEEGVVTWESYQLNENTVSFDVWIRGLDKQGRKVEYRNFKVEKGTIPTDWTPAPEDQVTDWNETDPDSYSYLKNKPTKLSQFENDKGYITSYVDTQYTNGDGLKLSNNTFSIDDNYFGSAAFKNTGDFATPSDVSALLPDINKGITAYDEKIVSASFTGNTNKTLTLTKENGTTVKASFLDNNDPQVPDDVINSLEFNLNNDGKLTAITSEGAIIDTNLDGRYSLIGHKHSASDINSGTLNDARLSSNIARIGDLVDTTYTAGTGLELSGTQFKIDNSTMTKINHGETAYDWGVGGDSRIINNINFGDLKNGFFKWSGGNTPQWALDAGIENRGSAGFIIERYSDSKGIIFRGDNSNISLNQVQLFSSDSDGTNAQVAVIATQKWVQSSFQAGDVDFSVDNNGVITIKQGGTTVGTIDVPSLLDLTPYAKTATKITAGTGLSGGGSLAANRTISLANATTSTIGGVKRGTLAQLTAGTDTEYRAFRPKDLSQLILDGVYIKNEEFVTFTEGDARGRLDPKTTWIFVRRRSYDPGADTSVLLPLLSTVANGKRIVISANGDLQRGVKVYGDSSSSEIYYISRNRATFTFFVANKTDNVWMEYQVYG